MIHIENEGALFRSAGFMAENPDEVYWGGGQWKPYKGETPKPQGWGNIVTADAAKEIMRDIDAQDSA